jgi:sugar phosphate isomerase/epimerase
MKLGCNTIHPTERLKDSSRQFGKEMQIKSLELIAQAGFDAVEYSHIEHLSDDDLKIISAAASDLGLISWSAHSWQSIPGNISELEKSLTEYDNFLHKSKLLGVKVIVVHCDGEKNNLEDTTVKQKRLGANLACLEPLADKAAKIGASVAIENGTNWADWQFIIEMVTNLQHPSVGLNIDTGHANLGDMKPARAIRAAGSLLITTHLQDNYGKADDHLPPGLGTIDWFSVVSTLTEVGYAGTYMVEISDCPPEREPQADKDIQTSYDNLSRFLDLK